MARLGIIDGNNWANRAYFALPDLRSESGERTGAVYGFRNMLKGVLKKGYSHLVVCFDEKGPTVRHSIYPEYKANRMLGGNKPDIYRQMDVIRHMLNLYGIHYIRSIGYEADDIIYTLCCMVNQQEGLNNVPVFDHIDIYSADKDLMQLVTAKVTVIDTNSKNVREFDEQLVEEHFGVKPIRIPDYLAIVGDKSDNIPGCDGIGKKGAADLVATHGCLEDILKALLAKENSGGKLTKKEQGFVDQYKKLLTSRELIWLLVVPTVTDSVYIEDLQKQDVNLEHLTELFARLSFKT